MISFDLTYCYISELLNSLNTPVSYSVTSFSCYLVRACTELSLDRLCIDDPLARRLELTDFRIAHNFRHLADGIRL